jgi:transcriptional regulator with XRE-family HTH domain
LTPKQLFRQQVAVKFKQAIETRGLSKVDAARTLGVSRETLYQYLNARSTPGSDVLQRACESWGISLNYRGLSFDSAAFQSSDDKHPMRPPKQLDLFAALRSVTDNNVDVKVMRKTQKGIELKVILDLVS